MTVYNDSMATGHFKVTATDAEGNTTVLVDQPNLYTKLSEESLGGIDDKLRKNVLGAYPRPMGWFPAAIMLLNDPSNGGNGTSDALLSGRYIGDIVGYFDINLDNPNGSHLVKGNRISSDDTRTYNADGSITDTYVGEFYTPTANSAPINKLAVAAMPLGRLSMSIEDETPIGGTGHWGGAAEDAPLYAFNTETWRMGTSGYGTASETWCGKEVIHSTYDFTALPTFEFSNRGQMQVHMALTAASGQYHFAAHPQTSWSSAATSFSFAVGLIRDTGYYTSFNYTLGSVKDRNIPGTFDILAIPQTDTFGIQNGAQMRACLNGKTGDAYVVHMSTVAPNTLNVNYWLRSENYATHHLEQIPVDVTFGTDYLAGNTSTSRRSGLQCCFEGSELLVALISQPNTDSDPKAGVDDFTFIKINAPTWTKTYEDTFQTTYHLSRYTSSVSSFFDNMYYDPQTNSTLFNLRGMNTNNNQYYEVGGNYAIYSLRANMTNKTVGICGSYTSTNTWNKYDPFTGATDTSYYGTNFSFLGTSLNQVLTTAHFVSPWSDLGTLTTRSGLQRSIYGRSGSTSNSSDGFAGDAISTHFPELIPNQEWGSLSAMIFYDGTEMDGCITQVPIYRVPTQPILAETLVAPFQKDNSTTIRVEYQLTIHPVTVTPAP